MSATAQLTRMSELLADLQAGRMPVSRFSDAVRGLTEMRQSLPPRYDEVLLSLLDRLEAAALFTEESCSFSVKDLHDSLSLWMTKAQALLAKG